MNDPRIEELERIRAETEQQLRERQDQYRSIFDATSDSIVIIDPRNGEIVEVNPAACEMYGYTRDELVGRTATMVVHPDYIPLAQQNINSIRAGQVFQTRSVNIRKDGTGFHTEIRGNLFQYQGRLHLLAIVRDATERVQAFELLERRVEERTREIERRIQVAETLRDLLSVLNSNRSLDETLHFIVQQACQLLGTNAGAMLRLNEQTQTYQIQTHVGLPPSYVVVMEIPVGLGGISEAVARRSAVFIPNLSVTPFADGLRTDERKSRMLDEIAELYTSVLIAPLLIQDQAYGGIALYYPEQRPYSAEEAELLQTFATQAALAIENAELQTQRQSLAALQERQRLARELHDSVSQALYGIALGAQAARAQLDKDPAQAFEPLDYVLQLANAGLAEMRALIFELRPESLEQEGLAAALAKQAGALRARHSIHVQTILAPEPDVSLEVKQALYRIAQEALQNIIKHANASQVTIRLGGKPHAVELEIADNGVGFEMRAFPGHLGLDSMRERAGQIGAEFRIESREGKGTRILVAVPFSG